MIEGSLAKKKSDVCRKAIDLRSRTSLQYGVIGDIGYRYTDIPCSLRFPSQISDPVATIVATDILFRHHSCSNPGMQSTEGGCL